ncbi:MAG: S8 family serine peptidase [Planctomycetaceae bacterium]|nr:S8 family serine peptidase [Planctomycetaceae bacterium]
MLVYRKFAPLGVRIFNLSANNIARNWSSENKISFPRQSWVARTIDQLSREHDVVFVVSAGNLPKEYIRDFLNNENSYPDYLLAADSKISDPWQAALAVSVGSVTPSERMKVVGSTDMKIADASEPSPFTRSGPGISKEHKPDVVEVGGNLVSDSETNYVRANLGTDVVMASKNLSPAIQYNWVTSFSAARVSHKLALILSDLEELIDDHISGPLMKAFLINSAQHPSHPTEAVDQLQSIENKCWLNVFGHGMPDHLKAKICDDYSIILYNQGTISHSEILFFDVPVPSELVKSDDKVRLSITVVSDPEVQKWGLGNYHSPALKWRLFCGDVNKPEIIESMSKLDDSDSEGEYPDTDRPTDLSKKFQYKERRRSRGTIQHDWMEWTHEEGFSDSHYTLAVSATKNGWEKK